MIPKGFPRHINLSLILLWYLLIPSNVDFFQSQIFDGRFPHLSVYSFFILSSRIYWHIIQKVSSELTIWFIREKSFILTKTISSTSFTRILRGTLLNTNFGHSTLIYLVLIKRVNFLSANLYLHGKMKLIVWRHVKMKLN